MSAGTDPAPGRRSARQRVRRVDVTVVLAVVLPVVVLVAALLGSADGGTRDGAAPQETPLTRSTIICPSGDPTVTVATDTAASGGATVRQGRDEVPVELASRRPARVETNRAPLVVGAEGALAPGLLAARFGSPLTAPECRTPSFDEWFTGVGAGAKHSSVLELVNPDAGVALVDATVYGRRGAVGEQPLRGVAVPGRSVVRIDLGAELPRRDELALHVRTSRGRVSAAVLDSYDELGKGPAASDYLPAQPAPSTANLLLGLPEGTGRRTLVIANPAETEVRASVKVVTDDAVFAAVDADDVVVPPESVTRLSVSDLLRGRNAADALGLLVESSAPVTSSARFFVDDDLAHVAPVEPLEETSLLVPEGAERLLLGGALRQGSVHVVARDPSGRDLADERVEVTPDRGAALELPDGTAMLSLTTNGTPVGGVVVAGGDGSAVVRLRPVQRSGLVADVRPGLP